MPIMGILPFFIFFISAGVIGILAGALRFFLLLDLTAIAIPIVALLLA